MRTESVIYSVVVSLLSWKIGLADRGDYFKGDAATIGPWVKSSVGEIWPKPQTQIFSNVFYVLDPGQFRLQLKGYSRDCDILQHALIRYLERIFPGSGFGRESFRKWKALKLTKHDNATYHGLGSTFFPHQPYFNGILNEVDIEMVRYDGCEKYPHQNMDEHYEISISNSSYPKAHISGNTVWGILRGMESFSQLIYSLKGNNYMYQINSTFIDDYPRFPFRGILVDTGRHFLSRRVLLDTLDIMEMNKFNVLHWHVTDHESFPYQSTTFPELSDKGAFDPDTHVYSQNDVAKIIEEARLRGIRVIPEFDTPGHMSSWEMGRPGLLTKCRNYNGEEVYGPVNPLSPKTYEFLSRFFTEVGHVFKDKFVHLGADEVNTYCWTQDEQIRSTLSDWKIYMSDDELLKFYLNRLSKIAFDVKGPEGEIMFWQEVFDSQLNVSKEAIIHIWKDFGIHQWTTEIKEVTKAGHRAILSAPWYLNYIDYGSDWVKLYKEDPHHFQYESLEQRNLVIGGEACMWGEFVNSINLIPRMWPRASAVAEKLWSSVNTFDINDAARRLQEHECRMLSRGFPVAPVLGAGFCPVQWD